MTDDELFLDSVKKLGFASTNRDSNILSLLKRWDLTLKNYESRKRHIKPFPKILFGLIDENDINAFATKLENNYIIAIYEGLYHVVDDLFNRMLSYKELHPNIGDPTEEIDHSENVDYSQSGKVLVNGKFKSVFRAPINEVRFFYAEYLRNLSLDFIFEHELSHVLNGHVDYCRNVEGIKLFTENSTPHYTRSLNLDIQTLEMDADSNAIAKSCHRELFFFKHPKYVPDVFKPFYKDVYQVLSNIFFSFYTTFKLFGDGDFENLDIHKSDHPDPRIRQIIVGETYFELIKYYPEIDQEILLNTLTETTVKCEAAYSLITNKQYDKGVFKKEYFQDKPLPKILVDNWKKNIRSKLLQYSYLNLAD